MPRREVNGNFRSAGEWFLSLVCHLLSIFHEPLYNHRSALSSMHFEIHAKYYALQTFRVEYASHLPAHSSVFDPRIFLNSW